MRLFRKAPKLASLNSTTSKSAGLCHFPPGEGEGLQEVIKSVWKKPVFMANPFISKFVSVILHTFTFLLSDFRATNLCALHVKE